MSLKLQVGKQYYNRKKEIVTIIEKHRKMVFPFIYRTWFVGASIGTDNKYLENGTFVQKYSTDETIIESLKDLVEEYVKLEDTPNGRILYK